MHKSDEEESTSGYPAREPRLVRRGAEKTAEHGLGAEPSKCRWLRGRPLQRFEAAFAANQGGTASILSPLDYPRAIFSFLRGVFLCVKTVRVITI